MKTYKPGQVSVIIGGTIVKTWNKVSVKREEDEWLFATGTSGETTRVENLNKLGTIEVSLPQSSDENAAMSAHQLTGNLMSCAIMDKSGISLHVMPEGTVIKAPDAEYGKEAGERVWTVKGDLPVHAVGGN